MRKRTAVDTDVCIRGNRRSGDVSRSAMDGGCRPTTNGGRWRRAMVDWETIRRPRGRRRTALLSGGTSGFNAVLGGNRWDGKYDRLEGHGIYWTASENDSTTAPFYNFGKGSEALYRQPQGQKQMGMSVR